jgi:hypothetical protein
MTPLSSTLMQFGVPLDTNSLLFFACLAAAVGLVYLFCRKNFAERLAIDNNDGDYVYQLLPRQLATREEYSKGFLIYFGAMVCTVVLLSLIGPKNLAAIGIPVSNEVSYVAVPLAIAFLLVGIIPNVPMLQQIERRLRQYAHERAYIPAAARATAQRLSAADFDFSAYKGDALRAPEMNGVSASDFTRSRRTLEHDWARLSCLIYELKSRRLSGLMDSLDADLLRSCERDIENIEAKRQSMGAEVARYREEQAKTASYTNDALRSAIRGNLYKLYILLGCAVRLKKQPHDDIDLALRPFGFRLNQIAPPATNADLKLVAVTIMAVSVALLEFVAVGADHLAVWKVSNFFPQEWYQPLIDATYVIVLYSLAIMVADMVRRRWIKKGRWFRFSGPTRHAVIANYVRIAIFCAAAGYVGLLFWDLAFNGFAVANFASEAPYMLLPAVTGAFYAWHLDNAELETRPHWAREIGGQAVATGICGLIAATASTGIIFGDASVAIDLIALKALVSATVGASFGACIPQAAATTRIDPLAEARDDRVRSIEAAAMAHFATAADAQAWLARPHPALGSKSPKSAATDVDGYELAVSLLQAPVPLAA